VANCASPKDPSAMRAVGVGPVDEITQRARPVNSAAAPCERLSARKTARARERVVLWDSTHLYEVLRPSAITAVCTKTPLRSFPPSYSLQAAG